MGLTVCQADRQRIAERVDDGVNLGRQSAAHRPSASASLLFWARRRLRLMRQRTMEASIIAYFVVRIIGQSFEVPFSQTPFFAQRENRVWTFFQAR